jgi:hypothetical protein
MFITHIRIPPDTKMLQHLSQPILQQRYRPQMLQVPHCMHVLYITDSLYHLHVELLPSEWVMCRAVFWCVLCEHYINEMRHLNSMQAVLWCQLDQHVYQHMPW